MILQALVRYYEILAADPESGIAPYGYSFAEVSHVLVLSPQGELLDLIPLSEPVQRGKKMVDRPIRMLVPKQEKRQGINPTANILCDNSLFILGITDKKDSKNNEVGLKRFRTFQKQNLDRLEGLQGPEARAVVAFLKTYDPATGRTHPVLAPHLESLVKGGQMVFKLEGGSGYVHEAPEVRAAWDAAYGNKIDLPLGQCLVTGEQTRIARLHGDFKGIPGSSLSGANLVGFNARAYESFNRTNEQGMNAPVGEKAVFEYGAALDYLLERGAKNRKFTLGDSTVVYWAESPSPRYNDVFAEMFGVETMQSGEEQPEPQAEEAETENVEEETGEETAWVDNSQAEQRMSEIGERVRSVGALDRTALLSDLDKRTRFYVLGVTPNAKRLSIRFFYSDPFEKMVDKVLAHYRDLEIIDDRTGKPLEPLPIWRLMGETVSKHARNPKPSPLLAGAVFRAVLNHTPYPAALYNAILNRVRADMDDTEKRIYKINAARAAIIKAYLLRKYQNQTQTQVQEVLCMALNENATHPAYLLGRLFAVLEKAQKDAISSLDASIKDRYFTSACASPASVFPVLLRLSQHHISKAEWGFKSDGLIQEILSKLEMEDQPIPAHLSLDEQGIFILGYYHQRANFYQKKETAVSANKTETTMTHEEN